MISIETIQSLEKNFNFLKNTSEINNGLWEKSKKINALKFIN
jgi:hypothetical protein